METVDLTVEHVRAARGLLKWTQDELASRAGVTITTISYWENERVKPSEETKIQVRRAFEEAGIEFANGGNPGVRLMRNREG
jgi:DNA-binding XRE family transcriptional regulator